MIGEEMLAAGAYLSKDIGQLSTIRTQDLGKVILLAILALGLVFLTAGSSFVIDFLNS
jgi:hypothetical protein